MPLQLRFLFGILFVFGLSACTPPTNPTQPVVTSAVTLSPTNPPLTETLPPTAIPGQTAEPVTGLEVEAGQLNGVTVEFWHGFSGAREQLLIEWVQSFNASNPFGVTVVLTAQDNLFDAVQTAIRAGGPPHLTLAFTHQAAAWDQATPPRENLVNLTPYLTDPVYGYTAEEFADFYPGFLAQETVNGKLIGLPVYRSAQVMFYNASWAQELGFLMPPSTPDEFKTQACASAQARGDGLGGWFIHTDTATTLGWIFAFGGEIVSLEGTYRFNTPEVDAAFRFLKDLDDSGCASRPEMTFPNVEFTDRQALFYSSSLSGLAVQQQAFVTAGSQDEWTIIPFPAPNGQTVTPIFGPAYNVFETTPAEQLAAWLFVQWASSPENQVRWTEISGSYPTRASTIGLLNAYITELPQWTRAYDLVPGGRGEPALPSWGTVRWVVSDAAAQLFTFGFTADQIPALLEELERTANEVGGE